MLTCSRCGNEEPEGSQFCGNCGAPFGPTGPEPSPVEPPPHASSVGKHRLRWFAVGAVLGLLVAGGAVAAALSFTGGDDSTDAVSTNSAQTVASAEDCAALSPVLTHLGLAADPSSADGWIVYAYGPDRDFLDDYVNRAPDEITADVVRLRDFLNRYTSAAQAAGAESGQIPDQAQAQEIKTALNLSSGEQDDLRTSNQILLAWMDAGCSSAGSPPSNTTSTLGENVSSEEDCRALGSVVADFTVGASDDFVLPASDITVSDYIVDRDFLAAYGSRAPGEIRADVLRLARFVDGYASAARAAGLEPGDDQLREFRVGGANLGSVEQDQVPESIRILAVWAANGCSGGRPPTDTTPDPNLVPTTDSGPTEPPPVDLTDEEVTALMNSAMSQRTEWELGSSPLGAEVRDCRKEGDVGEGSLLAPGGTQYTCEVWYEGELWSPAGLAVLDREGRVYVAP